MCAACLPALPPVFRVCQLFAKAYMTPPIGRGIESRASSRVKLASRMSRDVIEIDIERGQPSARSSTSMGKEIEYLESRL
jgi:hypothetical protein